MPKPDLDRIHIEKLAKMIQVMISKKAPNYAIFCETLEPGTNGLEHLSAKLQELSSDAMHAIFD
ncbi:MAG TPA: hypothetical protein VFF28_05005 [Candidatus Nanoarchaeia archaeon]|nr:hypothetical protein [Candidatus Nanoarchaeia archaeon]